MPKKKTKVKPPPGPIGRPPRVQGTASNVVISVRLTDDESARLTRESNGDRVGFARHAILGALDANRNARLAR